MTFLLLTKKRWPTFLSIWWQSNKRINIWTHRFVLCNAGIFSFSSFAFGPKFSSKIMASAALNITFSRCVCLHPEYEILFERVSGFVRFIHALRQFPRVTNCWRHNESQCLGFLPHSACEHSAKKNGWNM